MSYKQILKFLEQVFMYLLFDSQRMEKTYKY